MAWILIVAVFFSPLVFAQAPSSSDGDEKRIIVLENVWNQTQMNHDANAMASMLHSDFVFTDYDGTLMSKSVFLASIRDPSNNLSVEESNDMKLHRYGDTVVVTGATHEKGQAKRKSLRTLRAIHRYLDQERWPVGLCRQPTGIASEIGDCERKPGRAINGKRSRRNMDHRRGGKNCLRQ